MVKGPKRRLYAAGSLDHDMNNIQTETIGVGSISQGIVSQQAQKWVTKPDKRPRFQEPPQSSKTTSAPPYPGTEDSHPVDPQEGNDGKGKRVTGRDLSTWIDVTSFF
jgi:hypothetical protein